MVLLPELPRRTPSCLGLISLERQRAFLALLVNCQGLLLVSFLLDSRLVESDFFGRIV